jgi:hypothetical protein
MFAGLRRLSVRRLIIPMLFFYAVLQFQRQKLFKVVAQQNV